MINTYCKPAFMKRTLSFGLIIITLITFSCKKERSLENSRVESADGSLQADGTGECLPKTLQGAYVAGKAVGAANFLQVDVNVITVGSYTITTDTINGYYFSATGEFTNTGMN